MQLNSKSNKIVLSLWSIKAKEEKAFDKLWIQLEISCRAAQHCIEYAMTYQKGVQQ